MGADRCDLRRECDRLVFFIEGMLLGMYRSAHLVP